MHLSPPEEERLRIFALAELARRRRARGSRLGAAEAIALICDEVIEAAWDGHDLSEVVNIGRSVLSEGDVLEGVPSLVRHVQVEALFPNGTALVSIDEPLGPPTEEGPGAYRCAPGAIELHGDVPTLEVRIVNHGDRAVVVSSHFPLGKVNRALVADAGPLEGWRLAIPAGTSLVFEPGEERVVLLTPVVAVPHSDGSTRPDPVARRGEEPGDPDRP